jgi:nitroreductase
LNTANSSFIDVIRTRRNVREFVDEPVTRDQLESILDAARWAPNHRLTEPWRFVVLQAGGSGRKRVAELVRDWTFENVKNPTLERRRQSADQVYDEIMSAPGFMYAFATPGPSEEVSRENYAATACAVQNVQLAAHSMGLAVGWSTGKPCLPPDLPGVIGVDPSWQMVGALYMGKPAVRPTVERKPVGEYTSWL